MTDYESQTPANPAPEPGGANSAANPAPEPGGASSAPTVQSASDATTPLVRDSAPVAPAAYNPRPSYQGQAAYQPIGAPRADSQASEAPAVAPATTQTMPMRPAQATASQASGQSNAVQSPASYQSYSQRTASAAQSTAEASVGRHGAASTSRSAAAGASSSYVPSTPAASTSSKAAAPKAKQGGGLKSFLLGFLGAALAFVLLSFATGSFGLPGGKAASNDAGNAESSTPSLAAPQQNASSQEGSSIVYDDPAEIPTTEAEWRAEAVAAKVLPSIAAIDTYASTSNYGFWGYGDYGADSGTLQALGLGSGVVISDDGYILTNYHVVEGAEKVMVTVEGQEYEGTVSGTDPASDLAVVKVEPEGQLTPVEIGVSADLRPGQWVMTLGSPFGLEQSVATGIVSAVSRTVVFGTSDYSYGGQSEATSIYANMIQTDAAINPGNSGGALVDEDGKLIGINSVIESYSGSYSGVGFAIPIDYAINIAQQIIDGKTPTHAQMGVATTSVTASLADSYNLGAEKGAYVRTVYENSGASEAGLQTGDIITKINDKAIETSTDLVAAVRGCNVGDTVTVTYVRGTETLTAKVVLGSDENANISVGSDNRLEELYNNYGGGEGGEGQAPGQGNGQGNGQGYSYEELQELLDYFGYGN